MGTCIDAKKIAKEIKEEIKGFVNDLNEKNLRVPCLGTLLCGDDGGSVYYLNSQLKVCKDLGVSTKEVRLSGDASEEEIIEKIDELNNDSNVDGIIILLPLPKGVNEKKVLERLDSRKDVDGVTNANVGKFYKNEDSFVPCTPRSVLTLIKSVNENIAGKNAVVIGRSLIVGKPAFELLLRENATVTICHSKTANLKDVCKNADILVAAIGKPNFVTSEFVKEGATVIDVGTSSLNGKMCGDVLFDDVINKAEFVTSVPGGVGALTTALLIKNVCEAYKKYAD